MLVSPTELHLSIALIFGSVQSKMPPNGRHFGYNNTMFFSTFSLLKGRVALGARLLALFGACPFVVGSLAGPSGEAEPWYWTAGLY